jgi:hypothetical protein
MATTILHKFNIVRFQRFHMWVFRWNRTMLNLCCIVVAILKMVTRWNLLMPGINSGHHNLPTHEMSLKSYNVEFVWYCGSHFLLSVAGLGDLRLHNRYIIIISCFYLLLYFLDNNCRVMWAIDILKSTSEIEQCWIFAVLWWPFWKWLPLEIFHFENGDR